MKKTYLAICFSLGLAREILPGLGRPNRSATMSKYSAHLQVRVVAGVVNTPGFGVITPRRTNDTGKIVGMDVVGIAILFRQE